VTGQVSEALALGAGYTRRHRLYEHGGVVAGGACALALLWRIWRIAEGQRLSLPWGLAALVTGMLQADFLSGAVHWAFDTWGTPRTAVVGPLAIRTFREHHLDDKAMLRHDFVETNGHNFALSVLVSGAGLLAASPFWAHALFFTALFVAATSQIHKWAHMERPPRVVQRLQRARLILSPAHHAGHHRSPRTRNYCITTGWLDGPLRLLRVWESLEAIIARVTGARPRPG
jgi:ubiquitin-conjugating enzyme E2 variant